MENEKNLRTEDAEEEHFRIDPSITCNGCRWLDFRRCVCRKEDDRIRPLCSYVNETGFISVIKPTGCNDKQGRKVKEKSSPVSLSEK